ncbi:hypothetical protein [Streptomyces sp. NPDC059371]|uniref:hypothetical protein n=1 Tax=Streptomyces sp. NPDC059371 TaxID=3346812 RepID=UPI003697AC7F
MSRSTDRRDGTHQVEERKTQVARHLQPRHITLGGREAVALTVREYEQLIASRRQIGGQSARVRVLADQVKRTEQLLRDLESLVQAAKGVCPEETGTVATRCAASCAGTSGTLGESDRDCLRCAVVDLLRRHREPSS